MTRKQYRKIAESIYLHLYIMSSDDDFMQDNVKDFINRLADILEEDNPNFNRDLFITACKEGMSAWQKQSK